MERYRVLWIDDQLGNDFVSEACEQGLDIVQVTSHNEGVNMLKNTSMSWDAIILDANCKINVDDANESVGSMTESISYITEHYTGDKYIPWFVYTGGGYDSYDHLDLMIKNRSWDLDRKYYKKPLEMNLLFCNIKKAANEHPETKLKLKYTDVITPYEELHNELIKILSAVENGETNNPSYLTDIRKVLEWLRGQFLTLELMPSSITELNGFSHYLCDIAPVSIQRSIHSAIVISQEGSHRLTVDKEIRSGLAPYLLRSTTFELLNILIWCKKLFTNEEHMRSTRELALKYMPEGVIKQDSKRNYHCGEYLLKYSNMTPENIGQIVKIKSYALNTKDTKDIYPHFVHDFEIITE